MRLSIEFSNRIPDKIFFDYVSIPIIPFIQPPKRCFIRQRYGHSSLSCRRKTSCSNCAENHFHTECPITEKNLLKCSSCNQNHKASSSTCNYYKEALKIAVQLQESIISQSQAAKMYEKLYNKDNTLSNKAPSKLITPSLNIDPSQISSQSQRNSTQSSLSTGARAKTISFRMQPEGNILTNTSLQISTVNQLPPSLHHPIGPSLQVSAARRKKKMKTHQDEEEERRPQ